MLFCAKKKRKKIFIFGFVPFAKMGSAKKIAKKFSFCPCPPLQKYHNCGTDAVFAPLLVAAPPHLSVSVLYTRGTGVTIEAKVMKNHGNGKYDIQFQQDGNSVVRLSVPRAKLQIA